jgi:hypothetical protein
VSLLSADEILGADDRRYEVVAVPEWNGEVRLRSLSGSERDEYEDSLVQQVGNKQVTNARNARAKLVALCAVDASGQPLFTKAQVIKLGSKSSAALQRLFDVACRMNGFTDDDVKELEGNSDGGPSEPPTSDSPSPTASPSMSSSPASTPGASPSTWSTNGSTGHSVPNASTTSPR